MTDLGVPDQTGESAGGALSSVPAMPVVPAADLYRGAPYLLVQFGQRYSIGWQDARKDGPSFVVARISRLDTARVVDRFPMTEAGWPRAWRALVRLDADSARAAAATLAALATARRALAGLAQLNAASLSYLPVVFLGGYAPAAELAVGTAYDLRFLDDRLAVFLPGRVDALAGVPYADIEGVDIGGPGLVNRWSAGAQAGLALVLGLPGVLLGTGETKIQTIVRINTADRELFFLNTQKQADALRMELSVPLKAIRDARAAASHGHPDPPAPESITDQLTRLASMLEAGLLTRQEFDHLKARLIAQS